MLMVQLLILMQLMILLDRLIAGQRSDNATKNVEIMTPLNCLNNFWRTLEISLENQSALSEITNTKTYVLIVVLETCLNN